MAGAALAVVTLALTASPAGAASGAASGAVRWFHSPTGNIECELAANDPRGTYAYCQTFVPTQTATLRPSGRTAVCTRRACAVGNGPAAAGAAVRAVGTGR